MRSKLIAKTTVQGSLSSDEIEVIEETGGYTTFKIRNVSPSGNVNTITRVRVRRTNRVESLIQIDLQTIKNNRTYYSSFSLPAELEIHFLNAITPKV